MKLLMNGCLLLATLEGSTNEVIEEIGVENMFIFGARINEVPALRKKDSTFLKSSCDIVENGKDFYLLGSDFASHLEAQRKAGNGGSLELWMQRLSMASLVVHPILRYSKQFVCIRICTLSGFG